MEDLYLHELGDFLTQYRNTCNWLDSIGLDWIKTRYGVYEKRFNAFESAALATEKPKIELADKRAFDNAYHEANEIIRISNDLKKLEKTEFMEQIKKVLSGQEYRAMADNDQARDFLFELSTAARFARAGYNVSLTGLCDVVVEIPEGPLFVECKRLKSVKKIEKNVTKALTQIERRMSGTKSKSPLGLVALNVTDLIEWPRNLAPDSPKAAMELQRSIASNFLREKSERLTPSTKKKRILGSLVECSSIWYLSEKSEISGLNYARHTNFLSISKPEVLEKLAPMICNQDITA